MVFLPKSRMMIFGLARPKELAGRI
jgi:hypothetical protein